MISIIGTRLAASAALFLLLLGLAMVLPEDVYTLLVGLMLILVVSICWTAFWFFGRRAVRDDAPFTLRIRTQDAMFLALASTVAGVLGIVAILRVLNVIPPIGLMFLVGMSFCLLMIAAPAVNALLIWKPWRPDDE